MSQFTPLFLSEISFTSKPCFSSPDSPLMLVLPPFSREKHVSGVHSWHLGLGQASKRKYEIAKNVKQLIPSRSRIAAQTPGGPDGNANSRMSIYFLKLFCPKAITQQLSGSLHWNGQSEHFGLIWTTFLASSVKQYAQNYTDTGFLGPASSRIFKIKEMFPN